MKAFERHILYKAGDGSEQDVYGCITVPDGQWVLEGSLWHVSKGTPSGSGMRRRDAQFVGLVGVSNGIESYQRSSDFSSFHYNEKRIWWNGQPFGVVFREKDGRGNRYSFEAARLVHKGELSRVLTIIEYPETVTTGSLSSGEVWSNLAEAAAIAKMDPLVILQTYRLLVDREGTDPPRMRVAIADEVADFWRSGKGHVQGSVTLNSSVEIPGGDPRKIWIPIWFARAALHLNHFGITDVEALFRT